MSTFLICHGAWSAGWAWKKVRPLLRAAGHEVFTPTYTGLGERAHQVSPSVNLETHIADVLAVIDFEHLSDIVLVGHSYGGMVATGVADRARDRIARLVYLDAFVPGHGQSLFDLLPAAERERRQGGSNANGDGWLLPPNPPPPDTSPEDVAWITPQAPLAADRVLHAAPAPEEPRRLPAAQLHLLHPPRARRPVRAVRQALPLRSGVAVP